MKCPGQDTRYWGEGAIYDVPCPVCGQAVEFFKDESRGRCPACGLRFRNPEIDLGCAQWCPHASACLTTLPGDGEFSQAQGAHESIIDRLIEHLKRLPDIEPTARRRGLRALTQAQALLLEEPGAPRVVLAAAALRGLGATAPAVESLAAAGFDLHTISRVASIVTGRPGDDSQAEARIVADAVALARLAERASPGGQQPDPTALPFQTRAGARLAEQIVNAQRPFP